MKAPQPTKSGFVTSFDIDRMNRAQNKRVRRELRNIAISDRNSLPKESQ